MKKCDLCVHVGYTKRNEQVCTKRLLYVEELEKEYPCEDFTVEVRGILRLLLIALFFVLILLIGLGSWLSL